jgi:hypothetical protein
MYLVLMSLAHQALAGNVPSTYYRLLQSPLADPAKTLAEPALVETFARNAYTVESSSAAELATFLATDTEKWEVVVKTTGIKID